MKNIDLYNIYNVENLWDIICYLDNNNANIFKENIKQNVLEVLKKMLDQQIIYIGNEWIDNKTLKKWMLSKNEIIQKIDNNWDKNTDFPNLYSLAWIRFEDWYIDALKSKGYTENTNWEYFVKNKIGDLEKWIEENKPK